MKRAEYLQRFYVSSWEMVNALLYLSLFAHLTFRQTKGTTFNPISTFLKISSRSFIHLLTRKAKKSCHHIEVLAYICTIPAGSLCASIFIDCLCCANFINVNEQSQAKTFADAFFMQNFLHKKYFRLLLHLSLCRSSCAHFAPSYP